MYEPIGPGYDAPELQTICKQLGLSEHRMSYYAVLATALGLVAAEVVSATFYHHTLEMVSPLIPLVWSIAALNKWAHSESDFQLARLTPLSQPIDRS